MEREFLDVEICGRRQRLAVLRRRGALTPILFLHGFGSSKEDFADIVCRPEARDRAVIAFDAPGCGESESAAPSLVSVSLIRAAAERVIAHYALPPLHVVGHSMGGLAALLLAEACPEDVLSFTNIEGNLAPEDCFFSRQVGTYRGSDPHHFLQWFIDNIRFSDEYSFSLYASSLKCKVRAEAAPSLLRSIVKQSHTDDLLGRFINLACSKMFMYGDANRSLSYIDLLRSRHIQMAEIPYCGHFPMYANPPAMWSAIFSFIQRTEAVDAGLR